MIIVVTSLSHPYNIWRIKVVQGLCNSTRNICFLLGYNSKHCVCGRSCNKTSFLPNGAVQVKDMHLTVCDNYITSDYPFIVKILHTKKE